MPHVLRSVSVGLLSMYTECLAIWIWMYGFHNSFVYKTLVWFASHLLLAVLANVMFYMIRFYRFVVSLQKEKRE